MSDTPKIDHSIKPAHPWEALNNDTLAMDTPAGVVLRNDRSDGLVLLPDTVLVAIENTRWMRIERKPPQ